MTLAELLYSRLSPKVPPISSPVPGYQYQYQLPRHLQDTRHQNIKLGTANQNNSSNSFKRFPFKVLNNIVGFKKTIFNDAVSNPSVPHFVNEIIDIKKNKLNALKTHLHSPWMKPDHISLHFKPSFQDNFRQGEELDKTNNKQVENAKIQSPEKLQVPAEKTPIDIALAPSKIFLGKNQPGTTSKC